MNLFLPLILSVILVTSLVGTAYAQNESIPEWVKGISAFWAESKISDADFIDALEFLINQNVIKLDNPVNPDDTDKDKEITSLKSKISNLEKIVNSQSEQLAQYEDKPLVTKPEPEQKTQIIRIVKGSAFNIDCAKSNCYIPGTAVVNVGDKVIFSNTDLVIHTFAAGTVNGSDYLDYSLTGEFNTGVINSDETVEWVPETTGEIPYYCLIHPWMTGLIVVQES